jgi:hypothetical protein
VIAHARECEFTDSCTDNEIVTGDFPSAGALETAQILALREAGWDFREGVTRNQTAACSPDEKAFVTVATGAGTIEDDKQAARPNGKGGLLWAEELREELRAAVRSGRPMLTRARTEDC